MRIVLDTNILVRANPKTNPSGLASDLLLKTLSPPNALISSTPILAEVERVLRYPHVQARWPLADSDIRTFLTLLEEASLMVALPALIPKIVSDPDDDPILQTAIIGRADVLCSRDVAFRSETVARVCRVHGIRVLDDLSLIEELRRKS